jgi:hypothetical protein
MNTKLDAPICSLYPLGLEILSESPRLHRRTGLATATSSTTKRNHPKLGLTCSPAVLWSFSPKLACLVLSAAVALASRAHPALLLATPSITYVQGNYATPQTPQTPQTAVSVTFAAAQAAGGIRHRGHTIRGRGGILQTIRKGAK